MNYYKLLDALALSATILVENGSEISRVNQTIYSISKAYGIQDVGVFVTPTGLLISFDWDGKTYSRIKSVQSAGYDIEKINKVTNLARSCAGIEVKQVYEDLLQIRNLKGYSLIAKCFASAFMALFFTLYFSGTISESMIAFVIGFFMQYWSSKFEQNNFNTIFKIIFLSALFSLVPLVLMQFGLISSKDSIITGCLMLVVPGLALISAIQDSIAGDMLSGLVRIFETLLISSGIVIGTSTVLSIWSELIKRGIL